jgi:hypothetical protein
MQNPIKSEIGDLVCKLMRAKAMGAKLNHKSLFEKKLDEILGGNHTIGRKANSF